MRRILRSVRSDESGQTLVEFGLVALLCVMTIIGVVDICRMVLVYTTLADAARIGVRYAIVHGSDSTVSPQVTSIVAGYLRAGTINTVNATVNTTYPDPVGTAPSGCNSPGCHVVVSISYQYNALSSYFHLKPTLSSSSEAVITY